MASTTQPDELLLPEGARLVHIGPHKTGTTSLQSALWAGRESMREQGVRLVGRSRNPANAVRAITGQAAPTSDDDAPPSIRHWNDLVREVRRAREPRVVLSSEFFAWASPEVISRIANTLDPARLHIAVTLRPLARILPSQWQQNVQAGSVLAYEAWLEMLFREPGERAPWSFWSLHRHDELIARWAREVGPDRVTVIVVDDHDRGLVLRVFERLLGLREGTLVAERDLTNRSLTLPEVEAVRSFNLSLRDKALSRAVHTKVMRYGAGLHMKARVPGHDEPRIETPRWALDRAREVEREMVAAIAASGVRVAGDLDGLTQVEAGGPARDGQPGTPPIPPDVAAALAMGVLLASGLAREGKDLRATGPGPWVEPVELARVSTWQVAVVMARRLLGAVLGRWWAVRGRVRSALGTR